MSIHLTRARKYFGKAREVVDTRSTFVLDAVQKTRSEIDTIENDSDLSAEGREKRKAEAKAKHGTEFLQGVYDLNQMRLYNLRSAAKYADKVVYEPLKKPDATKLERFESELKAIKTQITLSTNPKRAHEKFDTFVKRIDDAYLAEIVRDQYTEIVAPILPSADGWLKVSLSQTFEYLKDGFEPEDVKEARKILESAQSQLESPELFSNRGLFQDSVNEVFGTHHGRYLSDTESFFIENEELRPAEYVDPDAKADAEADTRAADNKAYIDGVTEAALLNASAAEAQARADSLQKRIDFLQGQVSGGQTE